MAIVKRFNPQTNRMEPFNTETGGLATPSEIAATTTTHPTTTTTPLTAREKLAEQEKKRQDLISQLAKLDANTYGETITGEPIVDSLKQQLTDTPEVTQLDYVGADLGPAKEKIATLKDQRKKLLLDKAGWLRAPANYDKANEIQAQIENLDMDIADATTAYNDLLTNKGKLETEAKTATEDKSIQQIINELLGTIPGETKEMEGLRTAKTSEIENMYGKQGKEYEGTLGKDLEKQLTDLASKRGGLYSGGYYTGLGAGAADLASKRIGAMSNLETDLSNLATQREQTRTQKLQTALGAIGGERAQTQGLQQYYTKLAQLPTFTSNTTTGFLQEPTQEDPYYKFFKELAGIGGDIYSGKWDEGFEGLGELLNLIKKKPPSNKIYSV